jgi:hypothetical protein
MAERDPEEHDLELLLRGLAGRVILALISAVVVVGLLAPLFERSLETGLVLGMLASLVGAFLTLAGFSVAFRKRD